jgi:hypothetical protein
MGPPNSDNNIITPFRTRIYFIAYEKAAVKSKGNQGAGQDRGFFTPRPVPEMPGE